MKSSLRTPRPRSLRRKPPANDRDRERPERRSRDKDRPESRGRDTPRSSRDGRPSDRGRRDRNRPSTQGNSRQKRRHPPTVTQSTDGVAASKLALCLDTIMYMQEEFAKYIDTDVIDVSSLLVDYGLPALGAIRATNPKIRDYITDTIRIGRYSISFGSLCSRVVRYLSSATS